MTIRGKQVVALIPARGGSKGVPGKNMREVNGIPLVGFTIQAALGADYIDTVYLSSDDDKILEYAKNLGIETIKRPEEFSGDRSTANEVIKHFISVVNNIESNDFYIIYLQPTSPLRTKLHVNESLEKMVEYNLDKVVSVMPMDKSPFKSFLLDNDGNLSSLFSEDKTNACRQDLPETYMPNGAIYIFNAIEFNLNGSIPSNGSSPYVMNRLSSLDVDNEEDFNRLTKYLSNAAKSDK